MMTNEQTVGLQETRLASSRRLDFTQSSGNAKEDHGVVRRSGLQLPLRFSLCRVLTRRQGKPPKYPRRVCTVSLPTSGRSQRSWHRHKKNSL